MREILKKLFLCFMVGVFLVSMNGITRKVQADDKKYVDKGTLSLNGQWNYYYLNKNEAQYIKIIVPSKGNLKITFRSFCDANSYEILDGDMKKIEGFGDSLLFATPASPTVIKDSMDLNSGTYYIRFTYMNSSGNYDVKADFTPIETDDKEPNNNYDKANVISLNREYKGYLTEQDEVDFYKIYVNKTAKYKLTFRSDNENGVCTLYDGDLDQIDETWIYSGDNHFFEENLKAGVYYIKFLRANGTGVYRFRMNQITNPKISKTSATLLKGKSMNLSVSGRAGSVSWSSTNSKVATVNKSGKVTAKKYGTAYIKAKVDGVTRQCKIRVVDPKLSKTSIKLKKKKSYKLKVRYGSGKITWKSSNKKVATVNGSGKITGKKKGRAYIYATVNGKRLTCKVNVK